jgi:hypothetical protein
MKRFAGRRGRVSLRAGWRGGLTGFFAGLGFGVTLAAINAGSKVHAKRGRRLAAAGRGFVGIAVEGAEMSGGGGKAAGFGDRGSSVDKCGVLAR